MIKLTDTHAHYDDKAFDSDRDLLLQRLFSESVGKIITIGCALDRWRPSIDLAEKYPNMYTALGLHPEDIYNLPTDWRQILTKLLRHPKAVALGEIGLDYHCENCDRDMQIKFFREQIELAESLSLPIIIHSRDATEDTMNILRELKPKKAVMHCFSGSAETAEELVKMGLYISFTGVLTSSCSSHISPTSSSSTSSKVKIPAVPPYWSTTTAICSFSRCIFFSTSEMRIRLGM